MTCNTVTSSFLTSIQACLNANLLQRSRCGNSYLAFGQGGGRKAFLSKEIDYESSYKSVWIV
jgi:hypothetical protein